MLPLCDQKYSKTVILVLLQSKIAVFCIYFVMFIHWIFSIITPVYSVTCSSRNHYNTLICCSKTFMIIIIINNWKHTILFTLHCVYVWHLALSEFWLCHPVPLYFFINILLYLILTICTQEHYPTRSSRQQTPFFSIFSSIFQSIACLLPSL